MRRRLAGAHLAREAHERLAVLDAVAEVGDGFEVLGGRVEEPGVVTGGKWIFAQPKVRLEHRVLREIVVRGP